MQPTNTPTDLSVADNLLAANQTGINAIQTQLASAVDGILTPQQQAIANTRRSLTATGNRAVGFQANLANGIQSALGEIAQSAVQPGAQAVQQIGQATATGQFSSRPMTPAEAQFFSTHPLPGTQDYLGPGVPGGISEGPGQPVAPPQTPPPQTFGQPPTPQAPPSGVPVAGAPPGATTPLQPAAGAPNVPLIPPTIPQGCTTAVPDLFQLGIPPVGGKAFCDSLPQIRQQFATLGNYLIGFATDQLGLTDFSDAMTAADGSSTWFGQVASMVNPVAWFVRLLRILPAGNLQKFKDAIACWWAVIKSTKFCNIDELASLSIVKAAINALEKMRIGTDALIWLTIDVRMTLDPINQTLDYLIACSCTTEIPQAGEIVESYLRGRYDDNTAQCLLCLRGWDWDVVRPLILARQELITPEEWIQWGRRNDYDETIIRDGLRAWGFYSADQRQAKLGLYDELPTIQDHLHWLQRNVFDSSYVRDFSLLDGFDTDTGIQSLDPDYAGYTTQFPSGRNFWQAFGHDLRALGYTKQRSAYDYAAHWINPAPGQLAEMMQRLRPGRVKPSIVFTQQDFLRVLAEQDVAPYFRERFLAISFRTLPLRQLNAATQQGLFNEEELRQRWQDIGFSPQDAATMAKATLYAARRNAATAAHGYNAALVSQLAEYRLITRDLAETYLSPQGFSPVQIDELFRAAQDRRVLAVKKKHEEGAVNEYAKLAVKAYADGTVSRDNARQALNQAGYTDLAADLTLTTEDLRVRMDTINAAVKQIHRAFRFGEIDATGSANALTLAGVQPQMVSTLVSRWQLEQSVPRISASQASILRWAKKGLISVQNALARLVNLGVAPDAAQLAILEVEQEITYAAQKAAAGRAKELAQAQRAAQKAVKDTQKQFCRLYTPQKMVKWYALRIIDEATFNGRLTQCGYTADERDKLFKQAEVARAANDKKAESKGTAGVEYTGPGADTAGAPAG